MTLLRHDIPISITLISPFATRGLVVDRASIDLPLARDQQGRFILPGTLVTGVLRAALERLTQEVPGNVPLGEETQARPLAQDRDCLFGHASAKDDNRTLKGWEVSNTPHRGQLVIGDLVVDHTPADRRDYPRIRIDRETGSVGESLLQFVEMPFAIGRGVSFSGIACLRPGDVSPERARLLLEKLLGLVPALGAIKSAGFGRLADRGFVVDAPRPVAVVPTKRGGALPTGKPIPITYRIDRPFLVGGRMASANLFKGSSVIPGAAIKGALATAIADTGLGGPVMDDVLSRTTIGHAAPQPLAGGEPWRPLPLSLATGEIREGGGKRTKLFDRLLAAEDAPPLTHQKHALMLAFAPDIKEPGSIRAHLGLGGEDPKYDVRTRTRIDRETGTADFDAAAEAGQLFSYAAVKTHEHQWVGRIVFPQQADPGCMETIAALLETGILGLGKTHAMITGELGEATAARPPASTPFALTLMTPAILNDFGALKAGRSLGEDYAAYWRGLGYTMKRFFATQELEGGYVALRYPPLPGSCASYLLTQPGSVFLLEPTDKAEPIEELLAFGLPPGGWQKGANWRTTPFLRENGFGEVRRDEAWHRRFLDGELLPAAKGQAA